MKTPLPKSKSGKKNSPPTAANAPTPSASQPEPAPGLDDEKHRKAQIAACKADVGLIRSYLPIKMQLAISPTKVVDQDVFRVYLDRILVEAGSPKNPLQRMLIEQYAYMNLRLADLQTKAAQTESIEGQKILNTVCLRIFREMRRTIQVLGEQRSTVKATATVRAAKVG